MTPEGYKKLPENDQLIGIKYAWDHIPIPTNVGGEITLQGKKYNFRTAEDFLRVEVARLPEIAKRKPGFVSRNLGWQSQTLSPFQAMQIFLDDMAKEPGEPISHAAVQETYLYLAQARLRRYRPSTPKDAPSLPLDDTIDFYRDMDRLRKEATLDVYFDDMPPPEHAYEEEERAREKEFLYQDMMKSDALSAKDITNAKKTRDYIGHLLANAFDNNFAFVMQLVELYAHAKHITLPEVTLPERGAAPRL